MRSTIRSRPLDPARDRDAVAALDAGFTTDVVYDVVYDVTVEPPGSAFGLSLGIALVARPVDPPLRKRYAPDPDALAAADLAVVAERDGRVVGAAAVTVHRWNRRAELAHLYVDATARRGGVGALLVALARDHAAAAGARCLWVETQNVNVPALHFYRRLGFACCGVDTTLYDPREAPGEAAVFLALDLEGRRR